MTHQVTDPNSHVFFVTSHGTAGDHWFEWLAKALNAHPEIMIFAGEAVRQKYFHERARNERPDTALFVRFLADLGMPYTAVGDCYSYRAYQLESLSEMFGDQVRFINVVRHPVAWLHFYVSWRCNNMRMPATITTPLDHEWKVTCHDTFSALNLKSYSREDVAIWSAYQGMDILNRMVSDKRVNVNYPLERIVESPDYFQKIISWLTHGRVQFDKERLKQTYARLDVPSRANGVILTDLEKERATWPQWKEEAWSRIVKPETLAMFEEYGYTL
ncbi:MAG: hypothetical protein HQL54_14435 [Magnetococcales bacterium]|nr:hypothetical protein [Magnetococcales bacterium]